MGGGSDKWYRLWKSGWLEQGGWNKKNENIAVVFLKNFASTNYTITMCPTNIVSSICATYKTTSGFIGKIGPQFASNEFYDWYACGQGA